VVFFDDYANAVVVGPTMRPCLTNTASPVKNWHSCGCYCSSVTGLFIISTWIGYELSLIKDSYASLGISAAPYDVFLSSLPFRFYEILMLLFVVLIAITGRDFGPMWHAEHRARTTGKVIGTTQGPLQLTLRWSKFTWAIKKLRLITHGYQ